MSSANHRNSVCIYTRLVQIVLDLTVACETPTALTEGLERAKASLKSTDVLTALYVPMTGNPEQGDFQRASQTAAEKSPESTLQTISNPSVKNTVL